MRRLWACWGCACVFYAVIDSDALWTLGVEQSSLLKLHRPYGLVCRVIVKRKAHGSAIQVSTCAEVTIWHRKCIQVFQAPMHVCSSDRLVPVSMGASYSPWVRVGSGVQGWEGHWKVSGSWAEPAGKVHMRACCVRPLPARAHACTPPYPLHGTLGTHLVGVARSGKGRVGLGRSLEGQWKLGGTCGKRARACCVRPLPARAHACTPPYPLHGTLGTHLVWVARGGMRARTAGGKGRAGAVLRSSREPKCSVVLPVL